MNLTLTTYRDGTLTSDSRQRIRSAMEAELRRGICLRHPLFDKLIKEAAEAAAKAVAAEAPRYLRIHQEPQTHQAVRAVTHEALRCFRIHELRLVRQTKS